MKTILTLMFFFVWFNKKIAGLANKDIQNKLKPYVPINEVTLNISNWFTKLNAIKFQGKPVKIEPLINSKIPKNNEKVKKEANIFFGFEILKHRVKHP